MNSDDPRVFDTLKRGDGIWVAFGGKGARQYAVVYGRGSQRCLVLKWRVKSKSWTGRVKLHRQDFLYRAEVGGGDRQAPPHTPLPADVWSGKR